MTTWRWPIHAVLLVIVATLGWWWSTGDAATRHAAAVADLEARLRSVVSESVPDDHFHRLARQLARLALARRLDDPRLHRSIERRLALYPRGTLELGLLSAGRVRRTWPERERLRFLWIFEDDPGARYLEKSGLRRPYGRRMKLWNDASLWAVWLRSETGLPPRGSVGPVASRETDVSRRHPWQQRGTSDAVSVGSERVANREAPPGGSPTADVWSPRLRLHFPASGAGQPGGIRSTFGPQSEPPDDGSNSGPATVPAQVEELLLVVNERSLTARTLIHLQMRRLRRHGYAVGILDLVGRTDADSAARPGPDGQAMAGVLRGVRAADLRHAVDEVVRRQRSILTSSDGSTLVTVLARSRWLLVGQVPRTVPVLPFPWFALVVAVGFGWEWLWGLIDRHGVRLVGLLAGLLAFAFGIPLSIGLILWPGFRANQEAALTTATLRELEQHLVSIDDRFSELLRLRTRRYRHLVAMMGRGPEELRKGLAIIDQLELANELDSLLLVSSQGVILRDYSSMNPLYRRMPRFGQWRRAVTQQIIDHLDVPVGPEIEACLHLPFATSSLQIFWDTKWDREAAGRVRKFLPALAKPVLQRFDRNRGIDIGESAIDDRSDLVFGSFFEGQGGDIIQIMIGRLGECTRVFSGDRFVVPYFDVIAAGSDRPADYFMVVTQDLANIEMTYLDRVFHHHDRWPAGVRFAAVASHYRAAYPGPKAFSQWEGPARQMVAVRSPGSAVIERDGRRWLVATLVGRMAADYHLVAWTPDEPIRVRLQLTTRQMLRMGVALLLILLAVGCRLAVAVLQPAQALLQGVEAIDRRDHRHRVAVFTADEFQDLANAFNQTLSGLEELSVARLVQTRLLPAEPVEVGAWRCEGWNLMTADVGGDFFDACVHPAGGMAFAIGDVAGHGVSAALVVTMVKTALREILAAGLPRASAPADRAAELRPAGLLGAINDLFLAHLGRAKCTTCLVGWARSDGSIVLASAGQVWPYRIGGGQVELVPGRSGFPIGASRRLRCPELELRLTVGDRLVLVTDGLVEAVDPRGEQLGYERLEFAIRTARSLPTPALISHLCDAARVHAAGCPFPDDQTVCVIERLG